MKYEVTSPTGQRYEINAPDGASQEDVLSYAQSQFRAPKQQEAPLDPTTGMSTSEKVLAGIGKGMVDVGRGVAQRFGGLSEQDVAEQRKYDAPLMNTGEGKVGSVIGNIATLAPAMFIPGANTVAGAAAIGAVNGLAQPTVAGESALKNTVIGGALGAGSQYGLGKIAGYVGSKLVSSEAQAATQQAQNSVKDAVTKASQDAGYTLPPSQTGAGVIPRVLEGVSGKAKTNQAMGIKNQNLTDALSRKELGLAADAPLTAETMQGIRDAAFKSGYEPVMNAGQMNTSKAYVAALDSIKSNYQGAANSFPGAVKNGVSDLVDSLKVPSFDAGEAIQMTRVLRDQATQAYRQGDNAMGRAAKEASKVIESEIERNLASKGKDGAQLLQNFRDARTLMAKSHSVEDAIVEGGGSVNAKVLAAALQRGKPLTGELKTIAQFANNFGDVAGVPKSGWANPITALDAFQAAGMAGMGAGPLSIALPAARVAARSLLTNPAFQRAFVTPSYDSALLGLSSPALSGLDRVGAGGLLAPVVYSQQQ